MNISDIFLTFEVLNKEGLLPKAQFEFPTLKFVHPLNIALISDTCCVFQALVGLGLEI